LTCIPYIICNTCNCAQRGWTT